MNKLKVLLLAISIVFVGGATQAGDKGDLEKKLAYAKAQYAKAEKRGFAWTTTPKVLGKAKTALAKGDLKAAKKFIKKALVEAEASLAQADTSDNNWQDFVPK